MTYCIGMFVCMCVLFDAGGLHDDTVTVIVAVMEAFLVTGIGLVLGCVALFICSYHNREQRLRKRSVSYSVCY